MSALDDSSIDKKLFCDFFFFSKKPISLRVQQIGNYMFRFRIFFLEPNVYFNGHTNFLILYVIIQFLFYFYMLNYNNLIIDFK